MIDFFIKTNVLALISRLHGKVGEVALVVYIGGHKAKIIQRGSLPSGPLLKSHREIFINDSQVAVN
jgi:hypothetical protein